MKKLNPRWPQVLAVGIALLAIIAGATYRVADPEKLALDDTARRSAPGQFVQLSDGLTHYELGGPPGGSVAVFMAGGTVPYYIWDPLFASLVGRGYRVLRYDYYGRGYSDRPSVTYTQDLYVRQLTELLDALGLHTPIHLFALSMGGSYATSFADRHPERVQTLAYIAPYILKPAPAPLLARFAPAWHFYMAVHGERALTQQQMDDFLHPERFPDWPERYRTQLQYRGFRQARLSEILARAEADQTEQLRRVGQNPRPVLLIWGREDRAAPFERSSEFLTLVPGAKFVAVDEAAHLPHWEQPEVVQRAVDDFFGGIETSSWIPPKPGGS